MFYPQDAKIKSLSIHAVGNKTQDEFYQLSDQSFEVDEDLEGLIMKNLLTPFSKVNKVYELFHPSGDVQLNEMHTIASSLFFGPELPIQTLGDFHFYNELSKQVAKLLYETSEHPKISRGELFVIYLEGVQFEGEQTDAIGIFKTDTRSPFLNLSPSFSDGLTGIEVKYDLNGVDLSAIDKGAIIINRPDAYSVLVSDFKSQVDRQQWVDEFLQLQDREDSYSKTEKLMLATRVFINEKVDDVFDISKTEKAVLANKALDYFKAHETFDLEEFKQDVLSNQDLACGIFDTNYKDLFEEEIPEQSEINTAALKKQQSKFKQVVKLDKNFVIEIKSKNNLMELGYDEEKGKKFYKVYFENEN